MRDTFEKFSFPTIGLHWIIAIGMIVMLAFGTYIEELPRSPEKGQLIGLHKSFGILIFVLAVARIFWRIKNKFPTPISTLTRLQSILAKVTHWVLIIGTVMMPISGIFMSIGGGHPIGFFGIELIAKGAGNESLGQIGHIMHGLGGKLMMLFIVLHLVGAIKHQFIDKDGTISRMLGKRINKEANKA